MFGNDTMMGANGMSGQFGYGFNPNQGNMNGMAFSNGMTNMNGMPNMMGNGAWNVNPMGTFPNSHNALYHHIMQSKLTT